MNTVVKKLLPRTWRSDEMHETYERERTSDVASDLCPLCNSLTITEFKHWRIIGNKYPYDAVAAKHDMLLTKRHVSTDVDLTDEEVAELLQLKVTVLNDSYTFIMEALPKNKSVPGHYHLHLVVPKVIT